MPLPLPYGVYVSRYALRFLDLLRGDLVLTGCLEFAGQGRGRCTRPASKTVTSRLGIVNSHNMLFLRGRLPV